VWRSSRSTQTVEAAPLKEAAMRRMMVLTALLLVTAACGGESTGITTPDVVELVGSSSLSGVVNEEAQGLMRPSHGAHIVLERAGGIVDTICDAEGRFSIGGLAAGAWRVSVSKPGYTPNVRLIQLGADASLDVILYRAQPDRERPPRPY
jgi:hypothetical protein